MKKKLTIIAIILSLVSCVDAKKSFVLSESVGRTNKILVVIDNSQWQGIVGDELRNFIGEHIVGLPQPETVLSVAQVAPRGFRSMMKVSRSVLVVKESTEETFYVKKDIYASPQTIIYVTSKDKKGLIRQLKKHSKEIIKTFKEADIKVLHRLFSKNKIDNSKYRTLKHLGISLIIPEKFKTVDDTGEFLWLRQHLLSGIAKGDGTNNILIYSAPLLDENNVSKNILSIRDTIGKKYIPGSKEGMYMITEAAYTPVTNNTKIANKKAFETRGKWEVKNDFMAGPFLNYTIIDKENNRLLIFEGFTYAPSVNKREFIFELEAIAKSLKIQ